MNAADLWSGYERAFRSLLWRLRPRRLQRGIELLLARARRLIEGGTPCEEALAAVYRRTRDQVVNRLLLRGPTSGSEAAARRRRALLELGLPPQPALMGPDFHCDAALGGLARWLRAAGYDAAFWYGIDDDDLLRKMPGTDAILLTTDRRLVERGVISRGVYPALLISIALDKREQFRDVVARLGLPVKPPRCMACGGEIHPVEKNSVAERIPPLTLLWRDEYYLCNRCDRLYWNGTHWERIQAELER